MGDFLLPPQVIFSEPILIAYVDNHRRNGNYVSVRQDLKDTFCNCPTSSHAVSCRLKVKD